jgi:predicted ferric reductase
MPSLRAILIWGALGLAIAVPLAIAATSPLLAWRQPVYIASGLAGVLAMALLLVQPLLAGGYLPGVSMRRGRAVHRWVGVTLVTAVVAHVAGLWVTSPPDVIDALLFRSPTPFSAWGVVAMWALFAAALLALLRHRLHIRPRTWRLGHSALVAVVVAGSVVHAMLIDGTMGTLSKAALCALAFAATIKVLVDLRAWTLLTRRRA